MATRLQKPADLCWAPEIERSTFQEQNDDDDRGATPQKSIFSTALARVPVCFDISRYLTDKCFDIVWGCLPPNGPP